MQKKKDKLPKKFAEKWLKALRSGEYEQAEGRLYDHKNNGYCCLGLACEIVGHTRNVERYGYLEFPNMITNSNNPVFKKVPAILRQTEGLAEKLAEMNDDGESFKQIANWIEKNVEFV